MIKVTLRTYSAIQLQNLLSLLPTLPSLPPQVQAELLEGFAKCPELQDALDRVTAELDTVTQAYQAVHGLPTIDEVSREMTRICKETGWDGMVR